MKVLILTEGGEAIGLGHLSRCAALMQAIKAEDDRSEIKFIVKGDEIAKNFLKNEGADDVLFFDWEKGEKEFSEEASKADMVIIDSYIADESLYESISKKMHGKVLMIDDYDRIDYPEGVVARPSLYGDGKNYVILRKYFWNAPEKKTSKEIKNVLLTFADAADFYKKVANHLKLNYGFSISMIDRRENKVRGRDLLHMMIRADLCISGGGQITYELARCGVPTIGICFAENQLGNLESLEEAGFLKYTGWHDDRNILKRIDEAVRFFLSGETRKASSETGRNLIDGKGGSRILHDFAEKTFIKTKSKKLKVRTVQDGDCRDLWLWRNDPAVRKWCCDTKEISYDEHKKWFKNTTNNKKTMIYVIENEKGEKIGQARFRTEGENVDINVNLNPLYLGKGFGSEAIKLSTELFYRERPEAEEVVAEIFEENTASKKAFQKAGYIFSHKTLNQGKKIEVFKSGR